MYKTLTKTNLRPFTLRDAPAVIDLFNAHSQHLHNRDESDLEETLNEWTSPGLDLEETVRVVEDSDGQIIGYIDVWDTTPPYVIKYSWGILHPEHWQDDLYRDMLAWAEDCARHRIALTPPGTRVIINHGTSDQDHHRIAALLSYGYTLVRNFYRMEIEFVQPPQQPVVPDGIRIVPIDPENELKDAIIAMDEGFRDHWGHVERPIEEMLERWHHHIENSKDFDPTLWYLAKDGDQIAGVCRSTGNNPEDPDFGWVNQLCVLRPWRRQGLGMALLQTTFNEFYHRGKKRVGLGVDSDSLTNATRLYEKAGMHTTETYHTYELELRPGKLLMKT